MHRSVLVRLLILICATLAINACGGGSSSTKNTAPPPTKVVADQTSISLNHGQVLQLTNVHSIDSSGNTAINTATPTYSSDNPNVTVDTNGNVCAGIFDATHVVCSTKDASGNPLAATKANITITQGSVKSDPIPVFVHDPIETLQLSTTNVACTSQGDTQQYTATAFSKGADITSTVGPITFSLIDATIGSVDANGLVTAKLPGATNVLATASGTKSSPLSFATCPPGQILLHKSGSFTDFSFSPTVGNTQQFLAEVFDIKGKVLTGLSLTPINPFSTVATINGSTVITGVDSGSGSALVACLPPSCNPTSAIAASVAGVGAPVYSNLAFGTVPGTSATTVYVTGPKNPDGSANTSLIPIDSNTNTAGTAITLPQSPNSMIFSNTGTRAFLGSDNGLMVLDPASNSVIVTLPSLTGKVLAVSPDGSKLLVSDPSKGAVFAFDNSRAVVLDTLNIGNGIAADWSIDSSKAFITDGVNVYAYVPGSKLATISINAQAVASLPQGSATYVGGNSIQALATCNNSVVNGQAASVSALRATRFGDHLIGANASNWIDLALSASGVCPPAVSSTLVSQALTGGAGTPSEITVLPDGRFAFVTSSKLGAGQTPGCCVPAYNPATASAFTVPLAAGSGTLLAGSATQDGQAVYVGVIDPTGQSVHVLATGGNSPTDVKQIPTTFIPSLVAVRPK